MFSVEKFYAALKSQGIGISKDTRHERRLRPHARGHEVDFVARRPGGGEELIQVAADATDAATAERELRALGDAGTRYPKAVKRLLTLTRDRLPSEVPSDIVAQPACEWLLPADGED